MTIETTIGPIVFGLAQVAAPEQREAGDRADVLPRGDGALIVVADGLGHGPEAELAATRAVATVTERIHLPPVELVRLCHDALRPTRGAVMSIATVEPDGRFEWLGVGNIQGVVNRPATNTSTRLVTRGGVVGARLPALRTSTLRLEHGDMVTMFTDGVDDGAAQAPRFLARPQALAEQLLARHLLGRDDALVLVGRFVGGRP